MKDKTNSIRQKIKNEKGLVIVEAAIVFPVMFFVLFFILFIGNMYYEQAKVDSIVLTYATKGAQYVADPLLRDMDVDKKVPTNVCDTDVNPYRYITGGIFDGVISDIERQVSSEVKEKISNGSLIFFGNEKTKVLNNDIATFKNYVLYSTFVVQVDYEIKFPIRFLGESSPTIMKLSSRAEVAVNDVPEFIRNVDMVVDLVEDTGVGKGVANMFKKINSFIDEFSKPSKK